jgi:hypothetical protein
MERLMHFLINWEAFFTEVSKGTPFTASAAMMLEKISPVPERCEPMRFVRQMETAPPLV